MANKKQILGFTLATAAAVSFAMLPASSALAGSKDQKVPCYGVNSCKGKGQCKGVNSCKGKDACKGKNECKGKGMMMKTKKDCKKAGGSLQAPAE